MKNKEREELQGKMNELFSDPDFIKTWIKLHSPYLREVPKVGRNEICPFCNSGKKFKHCKCYEDFGQATYTNKYEQMDKGLSK